MPQSFPPQYGHPPAALVPSIRFPPIAGALPAPDDHSSYMGPHSPYKGREHGGNVTPRLGPAPAGGEQDGGRLLWTPGDHEVDELLQWTQGGVGDLQV